MAFARDLLNAYGLSKTRGFLPNHTPKQSFENSYYSPWDNLVNNLPHLISSHTLSQQVEALPLLSIDKLLSDSELQRGYVVLSFLVHAIVWGSGEDGKAVECIPPQITEPYLKICEILGMRPVLSYAGLCLWNWIPESAETPRTEGFYELSQLKSVASFMNSRGEDTFYHVPVLVEAEGGPLVHKLLNALDEAEVRNITAVTEALNYTTEVLKGMITHLPKLYASLDANMFFFQLRPFLAGGKGMENKGLQHGFVFQRSDGSELKSRHIGGSAAQSSLFQFLDIVLGVEHKRSQSESETIFEEMRGYMPRKHREFLAAVSERPSLRSFVQTHNSDPHLPAAFEDTLTLLRKWRANHIAVVSKYVVRPARQEARQEKVSSAEGHDDFESSRGEDLQGTAGSALIPFLKQTRDETVGLEL